MLKLRNLSVYRGPLCVVHQLDLTVSSGETVALIGANGAGKTTLLDGILAQTSSTGHISLEDRDLQPLDTSARAKAGIALAPEGRRLFPSLTARENLQMGARLRRSGPWTIEAVLDLFPQMHTFLDRPAGQLSGGQQQMVALGRALLAHPKVLLLDEVSLGLAPVVIEAIYEVFEKLRDTEIAIILVEQDLLRALSHADRYVVLRQGQVVMQGICAQADANTVAQTLLGDVT